MQQIRPIAVNPRTLPLVVSLLLVASGCNGSKGGYTDREKREATDFQLELLLQTAAGDTSDYSVTSLTRGIRRGRRILRGRNWKDPTILVARVSRPPDGWIDILGLDADSRARGIFIKNSIGYRGSFFVFDWLEGTADRRSTITIWSTSELCYGESGGEEGMQPATSPWITHSLIIPPGALHGEVEVRVGLVLEDGRETQTVPAYIVEDADKPEGI